MYCKYCGNKIKKEAKFCKYCGESLIIPLEAIKTSNEIIYAGFWIRAGAFVIDYALLLIGAFILGVLFPSFFTSLSFLNDEVLGFIMIIIYHTFFLSIFSSTPGKILYKLRVIDEKTEEKVSFAKALARSSSYILSSFIFGLGFLFIGFDKKKHKGWHDRIAKTLVARKEKKSLILPITLSTIALCLSVFANYLLQEGYDFSDFSYLREGGTIINSVQQKLIQQPSGFCCSESSPSEIDLLLTDVPSSYSSKTEQSAEKIFENFSEAIVFVGGITASGEFGFGSGFLISPSGLFVTNYHVIDGMDKLAIALGKDRNVQLFDANLIVVGDPLEDIAVLKIDGKNLPYIYMGDSDSVSVGQTVYAIGSPQGLINTISGGMISQIRELEDGLRDFQITNPISEGSSGGALFNKNGEVIGITYASYEAGQNLNLAIPINEVKDLLGIIYSVKNNLNPCNSGCYFNGKCYTNPPDSHCIVGDPKNAWECDVGFMEWNNLCINCSDTTCATTFPGSNFSYYDENSNKCICDCPADYEWNLGRTACVIHKKTGGEICEDNYGSGSYWTGSYSSMGNYICDCKSGYVWNYNDTECVAKALIDQICQTMYGYSSYYLGYIEDGKYVCK